MFILLYFSVRIGLKDKNELSYSEEPNPKYEKTRTKRQQMFLEKNRRNTAKRFCKYGKIDLAKPISDRKLSKTVGYLFYKILTLCSIKIAQLSDPS